MLDKNNNRAVVRRLAVRGVRADGRASLLTALTIALTAMLVTAMVLQATGMIDSRKKVLERVQQVVYLNLSETQRTAIQADDRVSSTIVSKVGPSVEKNGVLLQSCYFGPSTRDMDSISLSEGRMAETADEAAVDKATLRAFGLPEALGTEITIPFLNSPPETFTVVGLTDYEAGGAKLPLHRINLSLPYAENGPQLAGEPWALWTRVKGGADMSGPALKNLLYQLGGEYGVAHQDVNPKENYIALRTVNAVNLLVYIGIAAALAGVSLLVVYSIFYLSVAGRVRQFGRLRTIGMTPRQLRRMVKLEGWLLWAMGVPAGFALASLFMLVFGPENGWGLSNNLAALAAGAAVCAVTVRLGVRKPAALAAAASPVEAARFQSWQGKTGRVDAAPRALTPWGLAKLNFVRGWKKQLLTMLSLAVGGVLFMTAIIYVNGWNLEAYSRQGEWSDGEYMISFDYNTENSLENGSSALQLQGLLGREFQSALLQLPGAEGVTAYHGVSAHSRWGDVEDDGYLTPFEREDAAVLQKYLQEGTGDYDAIVQSGGVYVSASGMWKELYGKVPQVGDEFEFTYFNGGTHTVRLPVAGVGGNGVRGELTGAGWLHIPRDTANALFGDMDTTRMLTVSMENSGHTPAQDEQVRAFMADYPHLRLDTLTDRMEIDAASYAVIRVMFIAISGFVVLFSLVNLLNTLLSSLLERRRQLSMLAALGMTRRQIGKMLGFENLLLAGVNLSATLTLGTLAGWGVCRLMTAMGLDYVQFAFPTLWFLLYAAIAAGTPALITLICLKGFYKESLTERLRTAE